MSDQNPLVKLSLEPFERGAALTRNEKKAPHKLAEKYGPVLDNFNDVVFITDEAGHFLFVNKASEQRTGIPARALIGRHFLELVDPKYHEFARNFFQRALSEEAPVPPIEMERQAASGDKITIEVNYNVLYEEDVRAGLLGVARDVTDRKRAKDALRRARDELEMRVKERTAALRKANELLKKQIEKRILAASKLEESEERYRTLFENSGDAVFIVDIKTGIILDANRQAERLTGRTKKEIIGMHQSRLHPSQYFEYYTENFQKYIRNGLVFDLEAEVVKKDGREVLVFITSCLIDLKGQKVIQEIFRDMSQEKLISDLKGELASEKSIRKAKAIIARHYKINESEAMNLLQKESRRQRRKLNELAQAVISSKFILK